MGISQSAALERAAVAALDAGHAELYGNAPQASRAWSDGGALLVILRGGGMLTGELARLAQTITERVYLETGAMLRFCGHSADTTRHLTVLAFERVPADALAARRGPGQREPLAGSS